MTEIQLHEPDSGTNSDVTMQTAASNSAPLEQTHKPMDSVEIPAEADNDGSSSDDNGDLKLSMTASVTTESTLPISISDESITSSVQSSPDSSKHTKSPQTPEQQKRGLPLSPNISPNPLDTTESTPLSPTPKKPLSKAESIRERRRMMEAWHDEQKSKVSMRSVGTTTSSISEQRPQSLSAFSPGGSRSQALLLGASSSTRTSLASKRPGTREEMARYSRMVERIVDAEKQANNRIRALSRRKDRGDARERTICLRERAELKLRLSQMEKARDFYIGLVAANMMEAVPMEILKTINDLPNYQPREQHMTLAQQLEAYVRTVQKEDPEEAGYMFQEIRDWKDSVDMALEVGATAPDFCLKAHNGQMIDSAFLRQQWRIILVFYHDYESEMCKMNLVALESLKNTFGREGAILMAVGFEDDTGDTAEETEVTFPLLADEAGILATKFGIIRNEELPILSTFIIDTDGTILWRYVNVDYTKRPEPMDILEALPEKNSKSQKQQQPRTSTTGKRKKFFRKASQKKW